MAKRTKGFKLGVGVVILMVLIALASMPVKQTLSVGTGYAAKRLCSEVYLAERAADEVWREDLALLPLFLLSYQMDDAKKVATVSSLGLVTQAAAYRDGLGCSLTNGTTVEAIQAMSIDFIEPTSTYDAGALWPEGQAIQADPPDGVDVPKLTAALDFAFSEPDPERPYNTRAVVVVYKGRIIAERYAKGFDANTRLLSWSMAKSVTNAMIGVLVKQGKLDIHLPAPVPEWKGAADPRGKISTDDLLRMSSGLSFDETYGAFGDVTDMLFVQHDAAHRAASTSLESDGGEAVWSYSSGDTNILARIVREVIGDDAVYHRFPSREIFGPIGAYSAVFETDPSGTFVGSSFVYMTARDWARFGLLYLNDGEWFGAQILPKGWVEYSCELTPGTPLGEYGAQWWLNRGNPEGSSNRPYPSAPTDLCTASGFETQRVAFIPSREVVIVRLGLTRTSGDFPTDAFFGRVLDALPAPTGAAARASDALDP
jgi:CubicO group peptidase (beta-lactamase class C family)